MDDNKHYTQDFDEVLDAELRHIGTATGESTGPGALRGLAFSGGGIRSASFALGLMQALVGKDKLKEFDYLSTVSGGGYIGASLTWFLSRLVPGWMLGGDAKYFSSSPDTFPFGQKAHGNRDIDPGHQPNAILDYIRQHGKYLTPGSGLNNVALIAVILRSLVVSLAVYTALLTSIMVALYDWGLYDPIPITNVPAYFSLFTSNWFIGLAACLLAIFLLSCFAYSFFTFSHLGDAGRKYRMRTFFQRQSGWLISSGLVLAALGSVREIHLWVGSFGDHVQLSTAGTATTLAVVTTLCQAAKMNNRSSRANYRMLVIASVLLIYGIVFMAYYFGEHIVLSAEPTWMLTSAMILVMLLVSTLVNINQFGIHSMYRDRLMETFLPGFEAVKENKWGMASEADTTMMQEMCQRNRRPYHLINTNLVLSDSPVTKYRGRGGDSFLISPLMCGSDATGWRRTENYSPGSGLHGISLATAMAISGAAVNPNAGLSGEGPTANRFVSILLAILNLRLGFWLSNPAPGRKLKLPPNFLFPGLMGGVLGGGLSETRRSIQLSDGGHFENLGIYELVRRKLGVILVSDAGADPNLGFTCLANAVEKIRVDFGAKIEFDVRGFELENLLHGQEDNATSNKAPKRATKPYAVASIYYEDGSQGRLIYLKPTFVDGLPADILGYKKAHASYPNESTADQFFGEMQFEAYRELGYCLGKILLEDNETHQWLSPPAVEQAGGKAWAPLKATTGS